MNSVSDGKGRRRGRRSAYTQDTARHARLRALFEETLDSFNEAAPEVRDEFDLLRRDTPELGRYLITLDALHRESARCGVAGRLCDLGGYYGIIAGAATVLGYECHVVDRYEPCEPVPASVARWWFGRGITGHDVDLQAASLRLPFPDASFDVVTLLAVIEHFAVTPRIVLGEIRRILRPNGMLIVDTPNAGALGTRVGFLLHGEGLWGTVEDFYVSEIPFPGHSRCYSRSELTAVLGWAGFVAEEVRLFDLAKLEGGRTPFARALYRFIYPSIARRFPDTRGCLSIVARRRPDEDPTEVCS